MSIYKSSKLTSREYLKYRIWGRLKHFYYDVRLFIRSNYQRLRYGFAYSDTWNFDYSISAWALPRLRYLKKSKGSYPSRYTPEEWDKILDEIIFGFEFILKEDEYENACYPADYDFGFEVDEKDYIKWNDTRKPDWTELEKLRERHKKGMILFAENIRDLWN